VVTIEDKDRRMQARVAKILALGLIWAVGVLALLVERWPR
jgi:hypothetical protein